MKQKEMKETVPRAIGKHKNAVRESKLSPPAFFSFSRMLCIRRAAGMPPGPWKPTRVPSNDDAKAFGNEVSFALLVQEAARSNFLPASLARKMI